VVPTTGRPPPARDGHTAVVHNDTMYIFAGFEEQFSKFSQDTYAFHFPTGEWSFVRTEVFLFLGSNEMRQK
jgi:N-acetylneuraminic acid mutarotase